MSNGTYENNAFPLASGSSYNHYGRRGTEDGVVSGGQVHGNGTVQEKVVYVTGGDFGSGTSFDTQLTIPAGSKFIEAYAEVSEEFALGGTTPTINVGTNGSEGTNYAIELSEAQAEATGNVYNSTGAGTFAAVLTADTAIGVALDGTTPTVTDAGKLKVVIRYLKV
jgi:hypothetical protein